MVYCSLNAKCIPSSHVLDNCTTSTETKLKKRKPGDMTYAHLQIQGHTFKSATKGLGCHNPTTQIKIPEADCPGRYWGAFIGSHVDADAMELASVHNPRLY